MLPYLNHAVTLLGTGYASREDIDAAATLGIGLPMGPLALHQAGPDSPAGPAGLTIIATVPDLGGAACRAPGWPSCAAGRNQFMIGAGCTVQNADAAPPRP